jgi:hypothetical protein
MTSRIFLGALSLLSNPEGDDERPGRPKFGETRTPQYYPHWDGCVDLCPDTLALSLLDSWICILGWTGCRDCFELMNHRGVVGIPLAISLTMSFAFAASGAENSASGTFAFSNFSDKSEIDSFE